MSGAIQQESFGDAVRVVFTERVTAETEDEMARRLQAITATDRVVVDCTNLAACRTSIISALIGLTKRHDRVVLDRVPPLLREAIGVMHLGEFFEVREEEVDGPR